MTLAQPVHKSTFISPGLCSSSTPNWHPSFFQPFPLLEALLGLQNPTVTFLTFPMQKNSLLHLYLLDGLHYPNILHCFVVISLCLFLSQVAINHLLACQQTEGKEISCSS